MPITKTDKTKDGRKGYRVRVNYTDENGQYRQIERMAYGKAEAQELERLLIEEVQKPIAKTCTVRDLYDAYMRAKKQEVRETTWDKSRRTLEYRILPELGSIPLDKLSVKRLQQWKDGISEMDVALVTKQNYYKELNAMLRWGVKREYLPRNPLESVGQFREALFTVPEETLHYYTAEQYLKFAKIARETAENDQKGITWCLYVFFSIAFYTGMRKGEINALRWSDIEGNILHVRRSVAQKLIGEDRITPPKNKSSYRDLQMPEPLQAILAEHKKRQKQNKNFSEEHFICGDTIPLRDTTISKANVKYAEAAGLPHIRIHDFRHTHATLLINEGINIQEIARRLGHSDVQITWKTYAHLYPREEERAVKILDKILDKTI